MKLSICVFLFTSCRDWFNEEKESTKRKIEKKPMVVYNLAYQENYKKTI